MTKKILLCDDELHILRAAEFKFSRAGYNVQCAGNGEEAWAVIERGIPDIVVTDCQMPKMNGLELAKKIKDSPETNHLPVIMLSAKGFELSPEELREEFGILKLLCKPFSPRELFSLVESLLEGTPEPLVLASAPQASPATAVSRWL